MCICFYPKPSRLTFATAYHVLLMSLNALSLRMHVSIRILGEIPELCVPQPSEQHDDSCKHDIVVGEVSGLAIRAAILHKTDPYAEPSCRSCASRLLIARSRNQTDLELYQDFLVDRDIRWSIEEDVGGLLTDGTHWFVLRQVALPKNEQQFLRDL